MTHPHSPLPEIMMRHVARQISAGARLAPSFLHIPKTGGTAFQEFNQALPETGRALVFPHGYTLPHIRRLHPAARISLLLRDPLERHVSGFNSRLRQCRTHRMGRPWSDREAIAFLHFQTAESWLRGLLSTDDYQLSAARYALSAISHLQWNYTHFFGSPDTVLRLRRWIGHVAWVQDSPALWSRIAADLGHPPAVTAPLYRRAHEAPMPVAQVLTRFTPPDLDRLRALFAAEYAIVETLASLA